MSLLLIPLIDFLKARKARKHARQRAAVLGYLCEHPDSTGMQIDVAIGMWSGTVYPILWRLELEGWLEGRWKEIYGSPFRSRRYSICLAKVASLSSGKIHIYTGGGVLADLHTHETVIPPKSLDAR